MAKSPSRPAQDNRANQLNPTHPAYHRSRGISVNEAQGAAAQSKAVLDNRANQLNPNHAEHAGSSGECPVAPSQAVSQSSSAKSE